MGKRYLLSYRRDIDGVRGDLVRQHLIRSGGHSVMDSLERMSHGEEFRSAIDQAINDCDGILVLIGPDWLAATDRDGRRRLDDPHDLVRVEVAAAIVAGKSVIPVLLDGARMPRADELPPELLWLAQVHAFEVDTTHVEEASLWRWTLGAPPPASSTVPGDPLLVPDVTHDMKVPLPPSAPVPQAPSAIPDQTRVLPKKVGSGVGIAAGLIASVARAAGRLVGALRPSSRELPPAAPPTKSEEPASTMAPKHTPAAEPVLIGVTAPGSVLPGAKFNAVLAAYIEAARASAHAKLERLGGAGAMPLMDIPPDRQSGWIVGAPVTVRVTASHADVEPAERNFEWNGRENLAAFTVRVHDNAPGAELDLCFHVALANVPIASIPLPVALAPPPANETPRVESIRTARSAFASYSSKDAQTVGYCLSSLTRWSPGLAIFQDCLDLNPNEAFKPQLAKQIASSDVFWLFWSRNASASPWVHWEYDTARQAKGLAAVIPMPLEDPNIAPPPPEFEEAHMRDRFMMARYGLAKIDEVAGGGRSR